MDKLTPDTTYQIEIISGGQVRKQISLSTAPLLESIPQSDTIYGQVFYANGTTPVRSLRQ